jgi:hypothetical protein
VGGIANVSDVITFGFGRPTSEGGPATINVVGFVGSEYGIWQSSDNAQTWMQIGVTPLGSLDQITTITGDMNNDNVYVGFGGLVPLTG